MAFDNDWDESQPDGDNEDSNQVDDWFKKLQKNVRQRLEAFLGITDFVSQTPAAGTELKGIKLDMRGSATSGIRGGSTSFSIRNNADNADNLLIKDDGDVTVRKNLSVLGSIISSVNFPAAFLSGGTAPSTGVSNVAFSSEVVDTDGFHDTGSDNDRLTIPAGKAGTYLIIGGALATDNLDLTGVNSTSLAIRKNNTSSLSSASTQLRDQGVSAAGGLFLTHPIQTLTVATLADGDFVNLQYSGPSGLNGSVMVAFYLALLKIG